MKYLTYWFMDMFIDIVEGLQRLGNLFRKKEKPSLIGLNIEWCTRAGWMERLVTYKQLELWTYNK